LLNVGLARGAPAPEVVAPGIGVFVENRGQEV
jgi:hypothetical protein